MASVVPVQNMVVLLPHSTFAGCSGATIYTLSDEKNLMLAISLMDSASFHKTSSFPVIIDNNGI